MRTEDVQIPRLHVDSSRTGESASETFARTEVRYDTAGCNAFDLVLAVPGYQVAVVDVVRFTVHELRIITWLGIINRTR